MAWESPPSGKDPLTVRKIMELVGRITRFQKTDDDRLQAEFYCTSKEMLYFFVPSNLRPPEDKLIRCFTHRPWTPGKGLEPEATLISWGEL